MRTFIALALSMAVLGAPALAQTPPPSPSPGSSVSNIIYVCGRLTQWSPPTGTRNGIAFHETEGSITVASRVVPIASGTEYRTSERPSIDSPVCVDGGLNASGALLFYVVQPLPRCFGGHVARYQAATATSEGSLQFGHGGGGAPPTPDSFLFAIPPGTVLPEDVGHWPYC